MAQKFGDIITRRLRLIAYFIAPELAQRFSTWHYYWWRTRQLAAEARALRHDLDALHDLDAMAELVLHSKRFRPSQKKSEIVALLNLLREIRPKYICEIGSYQGGTLALFCQIAAPKAQILAIDFNFKPEQFRTLRHFAHCGQRIAFIKGDSHASGTLEQVKRRLGPQKLDFLFIDGDHSLDGVISDFEMYAPYVRLGGIVAFHDIVPDHKTRFGIETKSYTGEVPEFWSRLKQDWPDTLEFVDDPEQDGFGIGSLKWGGPSEC